MVWFYILMEIQQTLFARWRSMLLKSNWAATRAGKNGQKRLCTSNTFHGLIISFGDGTSGGQLLRHKGGCLPHTSYNKATGFEHSVIIHTQMQHGSTMGAVIFKWVRQTQSIRATQLYLPRYVFHHHSAIGSQALQLIDRMRHLWEVRTGINEILPFLYTWQQSHWPSRYANQTISEGPILSQLNQVVLLYQLNSWNLKRN